MSQDPATVEHAEPPASVERLRRPTLERSEPRRSWSNLYSPGKADEARRASPPEDGDRGAAAPDDATARVVRDGYRIVEENLRRGRQVAAELRGAGRDVAGFAGRLEAERVLSNLTQTWVDPALREQLAGVARTFMSVFAAALPVPAAEAPRGASSAEPRVPLHPQERADFTGSGARVLKMRSVGPGEWLADLEIDGRVRRVQVRAVDGDL